MKNILKSKQFKNLCNSILELLGFSSTRMYYSQISASISKQSGINESTVVLRGEHERLKALIRVLIPKPPDWDGYVTEPTYFKF